MLYNIKALCNIELHKALSKAFLRVYFLLTSSWLSSELFLSSNFLKIYIQACKQADTLEPPVLLLQRNRE